MLLDDGIHFLLEFIFLPLQAGEFIAVGFLALFELILTLRDVTLKFAGKPLADAGKNSLVEGEDVGAGRAFDGDGFAHNWEVLFFVGATLCDFGRPG
ncbi:MAG: hypothetical protein Q8Q59_03960 [Luteolibacter sp.]|nr:hypothetical protein [Luteolibacter sp.]